VASAVLEEVAPATARILDIRTHPEPPWLSIAVAVARGERFDWLVEKATELGLRRIEPVVFARSVERRGAQRGDRWQRVAIAAMKQSGQPWLPQIDPPRRLEAVLEPADAALVVCDLVAAAEPASLLMAELRPPLRILVGPEGGFEPAERALLQRYHGHVLALPGATLRVETAALAAAVLVLDACGAGSGSERSAGGAPLTLPEAWHESVKGEK
jgi:16S rRNA (uracil1498-N3)-methyltransferase